MEMDFTKLENQKKKLQKQKLTLKDYKKSVRKKMYSFILNFIFKCYYVIFKVQNFKLLLKKNQTNKQRENAHSIQMFLLEDHLQSVIIFANLLLRTKLMLFIWVLEDLGMLESFSLGQFQSIFLLLLLSFMLNQILTYVTSFFSFSFSSLSQQCPCTVTIVKQQH